MSDVIEIVLGVETATAIELEGTIAIECVPLPNTPIELSILDIPIAIELLPDSLIEVEVSQGYVGPPGPPGPPGPTEGLDNHLLDISNPHQVTNEQVGAEPLGTVLIHEGTPHPSVSEKEALLGSSGTPSNVNRYVTNNDPRMSDARTPTTHSHIHVHQHQDVVDLGTAALKNAPASGNAGINETVLGNDTRLSDARIPTDHEHEASEITNLGTAAIKNVPTVGNAVGTEVVLGSDTRLSDARIPTAHDHGLLAEDIPVATTNFGTNLSVADDTVQKALETLNALVASGGASAFTDLTDAPITYEGQAGKGVLVKATEDGLEFGTVAASGGEIPTFSLYLYLNLVGGL